MRLSGSPCPGTLPACPATPTKPSPLLRHHLHGTILSLPPVALGSLGRLGAIGGHVAVPSGGQATSWPPRAAAAPRCSRLAASAGDGRSDEYAEVGLRFCSSPAHGSWALPGQCMYPCTRADAECNALVSTQLCMQYFKSAEELDFRLFA